MSLLTMLDEFERAIRTHERHLNHGPSVAGEAGEVDALRRALHVGLPSEIVPMLLWCPECGERHVDVGEFESKKHHTHACQLCGHVWRPAIVATVGVQFLPGFKNSGGGF